MERCTSAPRPVHREYTRASRVGICKDCGEEGEDCDQQVTSFVSVPFRAACWPLQRRTGGKSGIFAGSFAVKQAQHGGESKGKGHWRQIHEQEKSRNSCGFVGYLMAEGVGFEPTVGGKPYSGLL